MKIHSEAEILKAALSAEMAYSTEHSENYLERAAKLRKIYGEDIKIHSFSKEDDQNIENIKPGGYIIEVPSSNELVICFRGTKMGLNYKQEIYNDVDGSPVKMKFGEGDVL